MSTTHTARLQHSGTDTDGAQSHENQHSGHSGRATNTETLVRGIAFHAPFASQNSSSGEL